MTGTILGENPIRVLQPQVLAASQQELTVAISSLSLGGAEQIVIDWAMRVWPRWKVHLIVLRNRNMEWEVPAFVRVTRLSGTNLVEQLERIGRALAESSNPIVVCHLLRQAERDALASVGAVVVPVLHNAHAGWLEDVGMLQNAPRVVAVSDECATSLRAQGYRGGVSVIRHIPRRRPDRGESRASFRAVWRIPESATVIGMIGAVKPQKDYPFALEILRRLLLVHDAYLVILGGPVNTPAGRPTWEELVERVHACGVRHRVALPGCVTDAARALPAFDVVLNTSQYEGLSIATLEALMAGLPVVARRVGGQGELSSDGLTLMSPDAPMTDWIDAIQFALSRVPAKPSWVDAPTYRLWSLEGLVRSVQPSGEVMFVTANLNAGGAQRSLVNLARRLYRRVPLSVVVAGVSTSTKFWEKLDECGIRVRSAGHTWDAFGYAEAIVAEVCAKNIGTVVFWNTDARVKLLVTKALEATNVRLVEVSPGDYLYREMESTEAFQQLIAFSSQRYWDRINTVILKYHGCPPDGFRGNVHVIPNGVLPIPRPKRDYTLPTSPRIVVSGRIAPTKFILEIIDAFQIVRAHVPDVQLHVYGAAEHYNREYAQQVARAVSCVEGVVVHGPDFDLCDRMADFDACVVLGQHQGCPNTVLEALASGLPVIANNDGGTTEQIIHEKTGLLVESVDSFSVSSALLRVLSDRTLAQRLGRAGRRHVEDSFSMEQMTEAYYRVLAT